MHSTELKIKLQLESDGKNSAELSKKVMEQELLMKESKRENEEEKQRMQQLHDDQVDVLQKINQQLKVHKGLQSQRFPILPASTFIYFFQN